MKLKCIYIVFLLVYIGMTFIYGVENDTIGNVVYAWKLDATDYYHIDVDIDTSLTHFQIYHPLYKSSISNTYLGNLGLAGMSNILIQRKYHTNFIFLNPFEAYCHIPGSTIFYNTKKPFTHLSYTTAGPRRTQEQTLHALHTQNINPFLNVGLDLQYYNSVGLFQRQLSKDMNATLFSSYHKNKYAYYLSGSLNKINIEENGGLQSDTSLYNMDDSESNENSPEILPVNFGEDQAAVASEIKTRNIFVMNKYSFINKYDSANVNDTIGIKEPNMSLSLAHVFSYDHYSRLYQDEQLQNDFYRNSYIDESTTIDSAILTTIKNSLQLSFLNKFDSLTNLSCNIHVSTFFDRYVDTDTFLTADSIPVKMKSQSNRDFNYTSVGFNINYLSLRKFEAHLSARYYLNGYKSDDYYIKAAFNAFFGSKKDFLMSLEGSVESNKPSYYLQRYFSNHFIWDYYSDRQLESVNRSSVNYEIEYLPFFVKAGVNYTLLDNHIYYDTVAIPRQSDKQIFITTLFFRKSFKIWKFVSHNTIYYQYLNDDTYLRLPKLSIFSSNYFEHLFKFDVTGGKLLVELGFDININTKYYADAYMPATSQFYLQDEKKVGEYPYLDVFLNLKLKRTRLFVIYSHINEGFIDRDYFTCPHYPMYGRVIKLGVSWTFYD